MKPLLLVGVLLLAHASAVIADDAASTEACLPGVAARFKVPEDALRLILAVEGGSLGSMNVNSNRSLDLGPAQINTTHWRRGQTPAQDGFLRRAGVDPRRVRDDPCTNLEAAAFLLRAEYRASGSWAKAMVRYHHPTNTTFQNRYRLRLIEAAERRSSR